MAKRRVLTNLVAWLWSRVRVLLARAYALAILLLVVLAGYAAVAYVVRSVFARQAAPAAYTHWQDKIDARSLRAEGLEGASAPAPRAPLSRYHRVDRWFQPDPHNGCTAAGCHDPLPHGKHVEVRAFANLHTSFLACETCHAPTADRPTPMRWVSTATGQPAAIPAILELLRYFEQSAADIRANPAAAHPTIAASLRAILQTLGHDPVLDDLLVQIDSSEPGSPVWRHAVAALSRELPLHLRGQYGAKLAPKRDAAAANQAAGELARLTRQYRAASGDAARRQISQALHAGVVPKPPGCTSCHVDQGGAMDLPAAGYSPKRSALLRGLPVARLMQQLRDGQRFHLPDLLEPGREP